MTPSIGRVTYEAFVRAMTGVFRDPDQYPAWEKLDLLTQSAWVSAGLAAMTFPK